ncbi:MAG: AzlC family ABC transporter permease [Clostridia bacterium]|nr:AzlC family ABC transporter permease [Clostridia bacterium]
MEINNKRWFKKGMRDGIPISLGYFAVAFTLGIAAKNAGLSAFQATIASLLVNASAGEFAGFTLIAAGASYIELAIMMVVANARYLLMSCALSQKLSPETKFKHRLFLGADLTDELFGISMAVTNYLNPVYTYGAMLVSIPGWATGTCLGVVMGNILPADVVSALSVGLYGMFLAIIIPPAKKNKIIAGVVTASMVLSYIVAKTPLFSGMSSGMQIILLTVVISSVAALLFPVKEEENAK